jgi:hypothetical protein
LIGFDGAQYVKKRLCAADGAATILAVGRCSVKVLRLDPGRKFAQFAVAETVLRADDDGVDPFVDFGYVVAVMESWQRHDAMPSTTGERLGQREQPAHCSRRPCAAFYLDPSVSKFGRITEIPD